MQPLTELAKNHNYYIGSFSYTIIIINPIKGKTGQIVQISAVLHWAPYCHLHQQQKAFPLTSTPPSSVQMNGQSDYCCVTVGGTDTRGPVFLPFPWQNNASVVGPFVNHCNICILNSKTALSQGFKQRMASYRLKHQKDQPDRVSSFTPLWFPQIFKDQNHI